MAKIMLIYVAIIYSFRANISFNSLFTCHLSVDIPINAQKVKFYQRFYTKFQLH